MTLGDEGVFHGRMRYSGTSTSLDAVAVLIDIKRLIFRVKRLRLRLGYPLYSKRKCLARNGVILARVT